MWPLQQQKKFSHPSFFFFFFQTSPIKLKLGLQVGGREFVLIATQLDQSDYLTYTVCVFVCWLVVRSFVPSFLSLFLDYAREPALVLKYPICGFRIFVCMRKELSVIQQIV
jgi:hypothetical protein